jgi:hypothetical protein
VLKKAMITAAMGAAIVGGGTAALASSGDHGVSPAASTAAAAPTSTSSAPKTTPAAKTKQQKRQARRVHLGRALHATWVTKDGKTKGFVTHDAIHGTVSGVTSTAITIKAADGYSERFIVNGSTKVRMRVAGQAKGSVSSISQVKTGAKVLVVGIGKGTPTATRIVAGLKR